MDKSALVFLGPSSPASLPRDPRLVFRPPARRGDVARAVAEGFALIALVDGELYQSLAVTPRELRDASRVARIYGAASLGALRAVECPGMIGVGKIFEAFRDRELEADDEVVGTFDAATGRTIAVPFVIVRDALRALKLDEEAERGLLGALKQVPCWDRSAPELCRIARTHGVDELAFRAALEREPNVKQRDVLSLLEHLREALDEG